MFVLQACYQEYEERLPILTKVVSSVCVRVEQGKCKTTDKVMPAVTTVIGKMLGIYSNKLSAQRSYYGKLLSESVNLTRMLYCKREGMFNLCRNVFRKEFDYLVMSVKIDRGDGCDILIQQYYLNLGFQNLKVFQRERARITITRNLRFNSMIK